MNAWDRCILGNRWWHQRKFLSSGLHSLPTVSSILQERVCKALCLCACINCFFWVFFLAKLRWEGNATRGSLHCDYTKITKFSNKAWKLASNIYGWSVNAFFCFAELSYIIWSFSGRIWAVVCGRWESAGSDASPCGGRDSPCVQQQGQGPDGFCGEGPHGLCHSQQPCRTCWLTSACLSARRH